MSDPVHDGYACADLQALPHRQLATDVTWKCAKRSHVTVSAPAYVIELEPYYAIATADAEVEVHLFGERLGDQAEDVMKVECLGVKWRHEYRSAIWLVCYAKCDRAISGWPDPDQPMWCDVIVHTKSSDGPGASRIKFIWIHAGNAPPWLFVMVEHLALGRWVVGWGGGRVWRRPRRNTGGERDGSTGA